MSTIVINGNTYSGSNIVISNNRLIVNGCDVTPDGKEINIKVEGNINELKWVGLYSCCWSHSKR